ncbi:GNAT family N-acetyltransferase [Alicyclobacillus sp. SO9]|uniref:GNAT family N-acetyltransferase n=1 Tax=Alicyclobacillus sp. SO9 TaxID=2665646 RepID=UPI0018E72554|nr:GNAT family N-acetyltransferase [Alicyclobacillus sp. SO9]QQE77074.1 GNAT family N-acetyltransferase [Alicyclobacillus sp. SO9]
MSDRMIKKVWNDSLDDEEGSSGAVVSTFQHVHTERLFLRKPENQDVTDILRIHGNPATNRYNPHGPMTNNDEAAERLNDWQKSWANDGFGYWSIFAAEGSEIIGFGGISRIFWVGREALNLYYRFDNGSWGRGYATEIARTAVQLAAEHLPDLPVIARINPANSPSIKVAAKVGLRLNPMASNNDYAVYTIRW